MNAWQLQKRNDYIKLANILGFVVSFRVIAWTIGFDTIGILDVVIMFVVFLLTVFILIGSRWPDKIFSSPTVVDLSEFPAIDKSRAGYVYLVRGSKGFFKIGHTKDPRDRYQTFKLNLPFDVEYLHLIICGDRFSVEKRLHAVFSHRRVKDDKGKDTEWFTLTSDDLAVFKSIKEM